MSTFFNFEYEQIIRKTKVPSWYKAEKYYNCDNGWRIIKNFFLKLM